MFLRANYRIVNAFSQKEGAAGGQQGSSLALCRGGRAKLDPALRLRLYALIINYFDPLKINQFFVFGYGLSTGGYRYADGDGLRT